MGNLSEFTRLESLETDFRFLIGDPLETSLLDMNWFLLFLSWGCTGGHSYRVAIDMYMIHRDPWIYQPPRV